MPRRPSAKDLPDVPPPRKKRVYGKRENPQPLPAHLVPGNPGNSGGKKGRSGRTPAAFKRFCQRMTMGKNSQKAIRKIFRKGDQHPMFPFALKWASQYGYGMPKQDVAVEGSLSLEAILAASNQPAGEE